MRLHLQYKVTKIQAQFDLLDSTLDIYAHVELTRRAVETGV